MILMERAKGKIVSLKCIWGQDKVGEGGQEADNDTAFEYSN